MKGSKDTVRICVATPRQRFLFFLSFPRSLRNRNPIPSFPTPFLPNPNMSDIPSCLSAAYRKERTWNNFRPDIMKSGLQKYIRRGLTEKALYCAGELDLMKHAPDTRAEAIRTNFIHRLMVIYVEDVGVANLAIWPQLDAGITTLLSERKKASRDMAVEAAAVADIVAALSASEKSRSCSHVRASVNVKDAVSRQVLDNNPETEFPTVRDLWASWTPHADTTTMAELSAGFRNALEARSFLALIWANRIANSEESVSEYRKRKPVWRVFRILQDVLGADYAPLHAIAMRWYSELEGLKEAELCWMVLVLAHIQAPAITAATATVPTAAVPAVPWTRNREGPVLEIDEYVEDRHTAKGRGKSLEEFALVGAHVENESALVIQEFKRFYEAVKKAADAAAEGAPKVAKAKPTKPKATKPKPAPPTSILASNPTSNPTTSSSESDNYTFHVRTQLTTAAFKYDVYFATEVATGDYVVVKGPFKSETEIRNMLEVQEYKRSKDLPALDAKLVYLVPDRWSEGVPLGYRNKVDRTKPAPFLITKSILSRAQIHTKTHASKVWPETEVVDWDKSPIHFDFAKATHGQRRDYIRNLLVRNHFGIGDLADRNFLLHDNRVLSIDEESRGKPLNFQAELRKKKCAAVHDWIHKHSDELDVGDFGLTIDTCLKLFE